MLTSIGSRSSSSHERRRRRPGTCAERYRRTGSPLRFPHRDATRPIASPTGSVWGTATAAHQIEGGNWNNDWWALGARRPAVGCTEPWGDACDCGTAGPRTSPCGRPRVRTLPLLARVEPHRARGGRVLHRRARPLPRACARRCWRGASSRSSRSTTSRRRAGWPTRAAGRTRPAPTASPPSASGSPAELGDVIAAGVHDQRAEHGRHHRATCWASSRPARPTATCAAGQRRVRRRPPQGRRRHPGRRARACRSGSRWR